ncbi:MAG: type I restriction enzyme HsdR N-terminal domain-containing protein, partial [Synergistaceae bacterium]|nr:type I restriction enzyme HsdR N-terminal domain-containing protein [Synergistaceae bacterium]
MKLDEIFRDSNYKSSVFSSQAITYLEDSIYTKNNRGVEVPYVKCIIRDKEIRLTPEEAVRQLYIYDLIHVKGYSPENIKLEHAINFGREVKRADIVIFERDHPESEYIIVEVKKPKLLEGKGQLKSYCNATGALIGVWTNGEQIVYYHRKDPNYFEQIPDIPNSNQKLRDILVERWFIDDLIIKDKLLSSKISLKALIQDMEDEVLAAAGVNAFEEVFKLIYTKLYDELQSTRDKARALEFRNYGDTDDDLKKNIQALFDKAKAKWPGVFPDNEKIALTPSHLAVCVSSLQDVKLFNSNLDVIDDAFEYLMNKSSKGEKGQFFTPRYVIDMCVRMLNPDKS